MEGNGRLVLKLEDKGVINIFVEPYYQLNLSIV